MAQTADNTNDDCYMGQPTYPQHAEQPGTGRLDLRERPSRYDHIDYNGCYHNANSECSLSPTSHLRHCRKWSAGKEAINRFGYILFEFVGCYFELVTIGIAEIDR